MRVQETFNYDFEKFQKLRNQTVDEWARFSMTPQPEEVIRERAIYDSINYIRTGKADNSMCYSYICQFSRLSERLIEDLIIITSDLFYLGCLDNENERNLLLEIYNRKFESLEEKFEFVENYEEENGVVSPQCKQQILALPIDNKLRDKLDWFYIGKYQKLSSGFIKKYSRFLITNQAKEINQEEDE